MKIKLINIFILIVSLAILSSCNDDFMQKDSQSELTEETYFTKEEHLPLYLNQIYNYCIEGYKEYTNSSKTSENSPLGVNGVRLAQWDLVSDNSVRDGATNDRIDNRLTPRSSNLNWSWVNLRRINYFLTHYQTVIAQDPKVAEDPSRINKYIAEARFFRAYEYYHKILFWGEVPWLEIDLQLNSPELQTPRTPRKELVEKVLADLDYAIANLEDNDKADGRINVNQARFLKARFCLFEGTFRKYHNDALAKPPFNFANAAATSKELLELSAAASWDIIKSGKYELYKKETDSYWKLFTFKNTPAADGHKEAVLARTYSIGSVGNDFQRYYEMNTVRSWCQGATRSLVDEYLCIDGKPIYTSGSVGNYVPSPLFKGYDGMWSELENRDPRLTQTVCKPGEYLTVYAPASGQKGKENVGINYPGVNYTTSAYRNTGSSMTGYRYIKHWMGDFAEREAGGTSNKGSQTAIVFRYAETLLNYAEAKAELGTLTQADLDATINKLRIRAGFDFTKYPDSKFTLGTYPSDPRLDDIYAEKLGYSLTPLLREIRRERRVELAQEGFRYEDLIRWRAGGLFETPYRGMKMTDAKIKLYSGDYKNGKPNSEGIIEWANEAKVNAAVFLDTDGFIIAYPRSQYAINGTVKWEDRRYYFPIPTVELENAKAYYQNPGWEDIPR